MKKLLLLLMLSTACVTVQAQLPTINNRTMIKFMKGDTTFMDSVATLSTVIGEIVGSGVTSFSAGTTGFSPNSGTTGAVTLSGTLNVANGGTGLSTIPTNGQILIGNGTNYALSTITGGTGISVSNSAGGISISTSALLTETDGVIGNEVTNATTSGGLTRSGAGTNGDPYTLGIASSGVVTGMIADGTIATADIANNAVDGTKINLTGNAQGDLMYYNGTDWVVIPAGPVNTYLEGGTTPGFGAIVLSQLPNAAPNTVVAGPATGSTNGSLTARALVAADIPNLAANYIVNGATQQATSNFNISGNGTIGGDLTLTNILSNTGQPVNISASAVDDTINIGTGAALKRVVLGNTTAGTDVLLLAADSLSLSGTTGTTYAIGANATTGTISIGGAAQTGAISIGSGTSSTGTVNLGTSGGNQTINVGVGSTGGTFKTVNVGTGAVDNAVTIGGTSTGSSLTLRSGSLGVNTNLLTTSSFILNSSSANSDKLGFRPNTTGSNSFTGTVTTADLTANRTFTFPDNGGTVLVGASTGLNVSNGIVSLPAGSVNNFFVSNGTNFKPVSFVTTDTGSTISIYGDLANDKMLLNIPNVSSTRRGVMSTGLDTLSGNKTFLSGIKASTQSSNPALTTEGAKAGTWTAHTTTVNLSLTNDFVQIGTLTAAATVNLPTCDAFLNGVEFTIHKTGNDNFAVTIDPSSTQQFVDGSNVKLIYSKGTTARCKCRFESSVGTWYYESL